MDNVDNLIQSAEEALSKGENEQAFGLLQQAVQLAPDNFDAQLLVGICLGTLHRTEEGIQELHKAVELNPNSSHAHYNLGVLLQSVGRLQEAAQNLERALWLNLEHEEARRALDAIRVLGQSTKPAADSATAPPRFSPEESCGFAARETRTRDSSQGARSRIQEMFRSARAGLALGGCLGMLVGLVAGAVLVRVIGPREHHGMSCGPLALLDWLPVKIARVFVWGPLVGVAFGGIAGALAGIIREVRSRG